MSEPKAKDFYLIWEFLRHGLTEKALFQVILGLLLISVCRLRERGCKSESMCVCFTT